MGSEIKDGGEIIRLIYSGDGCKLPRSYQKEGKHIVLLAHCVTEDEKKTGAFNGLCMCESW